MVIKTNNKSNKSFIIFILFFLMYYIPRYIEYTMLMTYDPISHAVDIIKKISYMGSLAYYCLTLISKNRINIKWGTLLQYLTLLYFTYEGFAKGRNSVFVVLCLGLLFQPQYLNPFLKVVLTVSSLLFVITIALSLFHVIPDVLTSFQKLGFSAYRHSLGFIYAGQLIMQLVPIVLCYYYLNSERICWVDNAVCIAISTLVFAFSKTIMGYVLILCFVFAFNLTQRKKFHTLKVISENRIFRYMPYLICSLTFLLMCLYNYNVGFVYKLDAVMNSRIKLGTIFWRIYGIKLFGTGFQNDMRYYYQVLDSDYMYMLIACGIIHTIIAMWLLVKIMDYAINSGDVCLFLIFTVLIINSIVNNGLFSLCMNPFAIMIFMVIGKNCKGTIPIFRSERLIKTLKFTN